MFKTFLGGKIHRATVTGANLNYVGSITVDVDLLEAAGIDINEKVQIVNNNNGERFETYTIAGRRGSGEVCLNGAAARLVQEGDVVIIMSYLLMKLKPICQRLFWWMNAIKLLTPYPMNQPILFYSIVY